MTGIREIVNDMVNEIPGIMAAIFIDKDGIPLCKAGELKFDSYDLGAIGAVCLESCQILGGDLGQFWIENVIIEFDDMKVIQYPTAAGAMLILAYKSADTEVIRKEARNNIESLSCAKEAVEWSKGQFVPSPIPQSDSELLKLISLFKEVE
jgi:predicted regulator of Ras-like GTPase activity (Roadblock/LC7/MglB family)